MSCVITVKAIELENDVLRLFSNTPLNQMSIRPGWFLGSATNRHGPPGLTFFPEGFDVTHVCFKTDSVRVVFKDPFYKTGLALLNEFTFFSNNVKKINTLVDLTKILSCRDGTTVVDDAIVSRIEELVKFNKLEYTRRDSFFGE